MVEEAPVATPVDVVTQEGAKAFSEDSLETEAPVEGKTVSEETVAAVDDAIFAAAYEASDRDSRDRGNGGKDGNGRDNNHKPRDPDPKGWKCDDRRGAYGCPWNDWNHDDKGRPVFNNQFTFDLKVVYFDGFNRVEVIVRAGTRQPINTPGSGAYAFVVVGVSNPNFAVNVGVGVFNSDSNCNRGCGRPATTQIGVFVNVSNRNVYYPRVDAYDCGCGVTYGNRYYDRIYVGGTREVIGNWVEPQGQPRYFQPWGYKESPASPAYVQGPPPEFAGYGKLGANPDGTTTNEALPPVETTNRALQISAAVGAVVLVLGIGGLLLVQRSRRSRRVNEP